MPKNILQIVPALPPAINDLGDYALNLARRLRQDFGIETKFLVGEPNWQGPEEIDKFAVRKISQRTSTALSRQLKDASCVLLHYVGYGHAKRGCPF